MLLDHRCNDRCQLDRGQHFQVMYVDQLDLPRAGWLFGRGGSPYWAVFPSQDVAELAGGTHQLAGRRKPLLCFRPEHLLISASNAPLASTLAS